MQEEEAALSALVFALTCRGAVSDVTQPLLQIQRPLLSLGFLPFSVRTCDDKNTLTRPLVGPCIRMWKVNSWHYSAKPQITPMITYH